MFGHLFLALVLILKRFHLLLQFAYFFLTGNIIVVNLNSRFRCGAIQTSSWISLYRLGPRWWAMCTAWIQRSAYLSKPWRHCNCRILKQFWLAFFKLSKILTDPLDQFLQIEGLACIELNQKQIVELLPAERKVQLAEELLYLTHRNRKSLDELRVKFCFGFKHFKKVGKLLKVYIWLGSAHHWVVKALDAIVPGYAQICIETLGGWKRDHRLIVRGELRDCLPMRGQFTTALTRRWSVHFLDQYIYIFYIY